MNVELLAPAGNLEICKAALNAGADAVYLAGQQFGARAFAQNLSNAELKEAVEYAHLQDKKIYVTVNTIIFEDEVELLVGYLDFLYLINVDAVIVQDLGLMHLIRHRYPDMEIHCSTQMHIHNKAGVEFLKSLNIDRVVLARETPLELIQDIAQLGVDLEVFIHGALCVSYSGQCNFSFIDNGRSANRGSCIQNCRWTYRLEKDGQFIDEKPQHYLSMKDLNTLNHVEALIDAGIKSFKIEGRMKSIDYVVNTVKAYRARIDRHTFQTEKLYDSYNRGFTTGHLFSQHDITNLNQSEFAGEYIGEILEYKNNLATLKLSQDLHFEDGLRIINHNYQRGFVVNNMYHHTQLVKKALKGQTIELYSTDKIMGKVYRTSNAVRVKEAVEMVERQPLNAVEINIEAHVGKPLKIAFKHQELIKVLEGSIVEAAKKQPLTFERMQEQLTKTGGTDFEVISINGKVDKDIFIPIKELNEIRRAAITYFKEQKLLRKRKIQDNYKTEVLKNSLEFDLIFEVNSEDQLEYLKSLDLGPVIFRDKGDFADNGLINESSEYYRDKQLFINEVGQFNEPYTAAISGLGIHLTNHKTIDFLISQQISGGIVSLEINQDAYAQLHRYAQTKGFKLFQQAYGKVELMNMKHCPINPKRNQCGLCHNHHYHLVNDSNHYYLEGDKDCNMTLYSHEPVFNKDAMNTPAYFKFTHESIDEINEILEQFGLL